MYKFGVVIMILGTLFATVSFFMENYRERKIGLGVFAASLGALLASFSARV
jgi:hypothetical protein